MGRAQDDDIDYFCFPSGWFWDGSDKSKSLPREGLAAGEGCWGGLYHMPQARLM